MRIVHDIETPAEVALGASLYVRPRGAIFHPGFRVTLTMWAKDPLSETPETLHIEGNGAHIRAALVEAIAMIDACGDGFVESKELSPHWRVPRKPSKKRPKKR